MRQLINSTYISLDGVIQNPESWPPSEVKDPAADRIQRDLLFACDALLMGRKTYESFAPVWSGRSGDEFTDRINGMAKYVVSSALTEPAWENTTVINGDPVSAVAELKEQAGMNIVQYGFGPIAFALMEHGLLDELRLWVHPFFVGSGGPEKLLYRDSALTRFNLVDTTALKSGIVILNYQRRHGRDG
jgi:dihydrofolate reductase